MHDHLEGTVDMYMTRTPEAATPDTAIATIAATMHTRNVSGVPVLDGDRLVGVVTRTDLIKFGALRPRRWGGPVMPLPAARAAEVMTKDPRTIDVRETVRRAGAEMARHAVHRVFVMDGAALVGVLSTLDVAAAVADARIETPLRDVMSSPIVTLDVQAPLGSAIDVLARSAITGVVIVEGDHPIGVFTQLDALASRDLPRDTPIETTFDAGVICLSEDTRLFRAAAHSAELDVRRVIVCRDREAVGVVSGLDFARAAGRPAG
jgi:CBS domain-containing protein